MSRVYTYSDARQNLASVLERAVKEGEVRIKRKDGQVFVIKPEQVLGSPLAVDGVETILSADELVGFIREGRSKYD
jgi:hypothetical protein